MTGNDLSGGPRCPGHTNEHVSPPRNGITPTQTTATSNVTSPPSPPPASNSQRSASLTASHRLPTSNARADVLIYVLRLADVLDIDLTVAVRDKLRKNAARYTLDGSYGSAAKQ